MKVKVRTKDGTVLDGKLSGGKLQWPIVSVQIHGSWFSVEVSPALADRIKTEVVKEIHC